MEQCKNEWLHLIKALDVHYCPVSDDRDAERKGGVILIFFFIWSFLFFFFLVVI